MMRKIQLKNYLLFSLIVLVGITQNVLGQSATELIELHKTNLKDLYATRGAPPDWVETGHITEDYLSWCINHYKKKTAIIIYSYENDTLTVNLFNQRNLKLTHSEAVEKLRLLEDIDNVNLYFSQGSDQKTPKLRGAKATRVPKKKLKTSFERINELLLPKAFNLEHYEHLIFVPIFNISTLPLAAFRINNSNLIDLMSYSIAPSLFELMVSNKVNTSDYNSKKTIYNWKNALFVGNPEYPKDSLWQFPDLPGAIQEINAITTKLPSNSYKKLTGKAATKENVIKNLCDYDLLYFATHGISNAENPMENSFLVLADSENSSPFLTLSEIMNIRFNRSLKADLVVLSACQTGLGKSHEGGIIGLARSFQIAGANHVVMSLWSIDDSETATLMELFFKELMIAKEMMPHEALRQAILKYKSTVNDNPKYWAAFSIFGVPY